MKTPSVVARDLTGGSIAPWLSQMDTSHAANSLLDEEDAVSIANYSSIDSIANGKDHETPPAPRASLFKNTLQQKQQTRTSILNMDDIGVSLTSSSTRLSPKALFSSTILSQATSHTASFTSLMSFEADDWQPVDHKKMSPSQKVKSLLGGLSNDEELIAYRSYPDCTFKYAPRNEVKLEEDLLDSERQDEATLNTEKPETPKLQVLSLIRDIPSTESEEESHGTKPTLANAQTADLRSSNDGSTKNVKSLLRTMKSQAGIRPTIPWPSLLSTRLVSVSRVGRGRRKRVST